MKFHLLAVVGLSFSSVAHAQSGITLHSNTPEKQQSASSGPRALPSPGSLTFTPQLGTELSAGGIVSKSVSQSYSGAGNIQLNGATVTLNAAATVSSSQKRFDDVYEKPLVAGLGASYGLSSDSEVFGGVRVVYARGRTSAGRSVSASGTLNGNAFAANATSSVKPSDYKSFGVDAGYRRFFPQGGGITPYLGALVGVQTTDKTDVKETWDVVGFSSKARVYDSSITPSMGLQVGVTYATETGAAFGIETGLRYDAKRKGNDKDIDPDFRSINDTGGRFSIPVMFTGRIPLKPENLQK